MTEAMVVPEARTGGDLDSSGQARLSIAFEDEHLLVVDKPAGMVVHPAKGHSQGTLSQLLGGVAKGGDPQRAGIVHRLDRDTSGF